MKKETLSKVASVALGLSVIACGNGKVENETTPPPSRTPVATTGALSPTPSELFRTPTPTPTPDFSRVLERGDPKEILLTYASSILIAETISPLLTLEKERVITDRDKIELMHYSTDTTLSDGSILLLDYYEDKNNKPLGIVLTVSKPVKDSPDITADNVAAIQKNLIKYFIAPSSFPEPSIRRSGNFVLTEYSWNNTDGTKEGRGANIFTENVRHERENYRDAFVACRLFKDWPAFKDGSCF